MVGVEMANTIDPFTEELFWKTVTSTKKAGPISFPADSTSNCLHSGTAVGRLIGGNLSLIVSLLGTRYFPSNRKGEVLFLEEVSEEPYRVDRMMMQLYNAGITGKCSAMLTGQFSDCMPKDQTKPSLSIQEILTEAARLSGKPFLSDLPFGHVPQKMTLPVGIRVRVDADARSVEYLEAAVH
jgi:muramoyltetrapeptide carboxypeptidase